MTIEVKAPDGAVISFPDNTSEDVIKQQMQKYVASAGQQQAQPAAQPQEDNPTPGVWERISKNFGDANRGTLAGSINLGASGGGEEHGRILALQSQLAAVKGRPSWLGAKDTVKIQSIEAQIEQLSGKAEQNKLAAQTAEANRKQQYEDMPAAQGFVENAAALAGQVAGSLATPETLIPGIGLAGKVAPRVVSAGAGIGERLMAKVTAPGMGKAAANAAVGTGAIAAATDIPAQLIASTVTDAEYDKSQTIAKGLLGAAIGAPLAIGTRIFKTPTTMIPKYSVDADHVALANSQLASIAALNGDPSDRLVKAVERVRQEGIWFGTPLHRFQQDAGQFRNMMESADHATLTNAATKVDLVGQAQLLRGVGKQTEYALTEGTFNFTPDMQNIEHGGGPSFASILEAMGDDGNLRAIQYMVGKRAIDLTDRRGITTGFSPADMASLRRVVAHHDQLPHFQVLRNQWNDYMGWILDLQRQGGLYSADEIVRIRRENPDYISFVRQSDQEKFFGRSGVGKSRAIKGGVEPFADFVGNTMDSIHRSIEATNTNIFKRSLYNDWLTAMPPDVAAKWAKPAGKNITATFNLKEPQLRSQLKKMVANDPAAQQAIDSMTLTDMRIWYSRQKHMKDGNFDVVYNDGVATVYEIVDPNLMRMIQSMAPKQLFFNKIGLGVLNDLGDIADDAIMATAKELGPAGNKLATQGVRWLRGKGVEQGLTAAKSAATNIITKFPGFAFITNPIMDTMQSMITGRAAKSPWGLVHNDLKAMTDIITNNRDYKLFMLNGGGYANISSTEAKAGLKSMYLSAKLDLDKNVIQSSEQHDHWLKRQFARYIRSTDMVDNVNRYSEYKSLVDQGTNKRVAALAGRNISIDFGKQGSAEWLQFLSSISPFLNTTVEAIAKEVSTVGAILPRWTGGGHGSRDLKIKAWTAGTALTTAALSTHAWNMYGMGGRFKNEYQNLPDYIRDTHLIIFYPGEVEGVSEKYVLKYPSGFGLIFGALPARMVEAADMVDINPITSSIGNYLKNTFNISGNPVINTGIAGLQTAGVLDPNEATTFTGANVIPKNEQALSEGVTRIAQKSHNTGMFFVQAGEATGLSPRMLEHTAKQAVMWLADAFNTVYDELPTAKARREPFGEKAGANIGSREWFKDALFNRLIKTQPTSYTKDEEKLHELMAKATAEKMFMALQNKQLPDMIEIYNAAKHLYPALGYMDGTNKTLGELFIQLDGMRDNIDAIHNNKNMTGPEKRIEIMKTTQARNILISGALESFLKSEAENPVEGMGTPMNDIVYGKKRFAEGGYVSVGPDENGSLVRPKNHSFEDFGIWLYETLNRRKIEELKTLNRKWHNDYPMNDGKLTKRLLDMAAAERDKLELPEYIPTKDSWASNLPIPYYLSDDEEDTKSTHDPFSEKKVVRGPY